MSIGFIGSGSSQKTIDIYSGGANRTVDLSLQNVLNKYDKIKTDLDRLVDQSQFNTYDITSRQHYNAYNKEAVNGWAENWYAEYRAVLALRADALQKKLQAAYNRVLERSAFADMKPDQTSVFAPYANRTYKDNDITKANMNNKTPISNILLSDGPIASPPSTVTNYTALWTPGGIDAYLNSNSGPGPFPRSDAISNYLSTERNTIFHSDSGGLRPLNTPIGGIPASFIPAWNNGPVYIHTMAGTKPPVATPSTTSAIRAAQKQAVKDGIAAGILAGFSTPPTDPAELSRFNEAKDRAVESALRDSDILWETGIATSDADGDLYVDDNRDQIPATGSGSFYETAYNAIMNNAYIAPGVTPPGGGSIPPAGQVNDQYKGSYNALTGNSTDEYMGMGQGNFKINVPMFGAGDMLAILQKNTEFDFAGLGVQDTIGGMTLEDIAARANNLVQSFVGTQYDNIYRGNQYEAVTKANSTIITPYILKQKGEIFDYINNTDAGYAGGSVVSAGYTRFGPQVPPLAIQIVIIPAGTPVFPPGLSIAIGGQVTIGPDLYYGHESAISNLSSTTGNFSLPTIGIGAVSISLGFGLGTPTSPTIGAIVTNSTSYDIFADAFKQILTKLKKLVVETMTVNSYASSSGVAMDSYASRAEYHFTTPGFLESVKALNFKMNVPIIGAIPFPIGDIIEGAIFNGMGIPIIDNAFGLGTLGETLADSTNVNKQLVADRLFKYKHGVQGAESRETETGAFFATNAFLSQFEMNNMESEYWVGTQQNEELVNQDLARSILTAGPEIIKSVLSTALTFLPKSGSGAVDGIVQAVLSGIADKELANIMYDLMYRDQDGKQGKKVTGSAISQGNTPFIGARRYSSPSSLSTEAYDYIESDHKPFEGDSDFNYQQAGILDSIPIIGNIIKDLFKDNKPDFVMDGLANTLRYTNTSMDKNITIANVREAASKQDEERGLGARGKAGRGGERSKNEDFRPASAKTGGLHDYVSNKFAPDGSLWADTQLGDINEVYSATRKVKFSDLSLGFGEFSSSNLTGSGALISEANPLTSTTSAIGGVRNTSARVERFVGSDSRVNEARYIGANPVNHETFTTNMYTGGAEREHYDRRNEYSLTFATKADSTNAFNLFGSQALNPTIGGFIKMATVDKNANDKVLIEHNKGGMAAVRALGGAAVNTGTGSDNVAGSEVQKFGGTVEGELNEMNQMLYEHMHLRADAKNLSTIREYRDVFETGLAKSIFISGQTYHPSGGGITSSIEIRYNSSLGRSEIQGAKAAEMSASAKTSREYYDASNVYFDPYNTPFLNKSRGQASIYLNNYFAYKKRASNNKT